MYPVAILQDRYNGVYSGGAWVAVADFERQNEEGGKTRLQFVSEWIYSGDPDAMEFGSNILPGLNYVAVGDTPDKALEALRGKVRP